jgi:hypothetical protein
MDRENLYPHLRINQQSLKASDRLKARSSGVKSLAVSDVSNSGRSVIEIQRFEANRPKAEFKSFRQDKKRYIQSMELVSTILGQKHYIPVTPSLSLVS